MTTSTSCRIDGTKLTISTNFDNKLKTDAYVLTNNWLLFCYSNGICVFSSIRPNGNYISIIPQTWTKENHKIYEAQERLVYSKLKCYPSYYLVPKGSKRKLIYTISFENEGRMKEYLTETKLMLSYTYQSSEDIGLITSMLGEGFKKYINRGKELSLKSFIQIDPIKHQSPPNFSSYDLYKGISICGNSNTLSEEQSTRFFGLQKYFTEEEYVNLNIVEKKK